MKGGVDDLLKNICHNYLQVLEGLSIILFDLPLVSFGFLLYFCYRGDGYFVIISDFFGIFPLFT